MVMFVLQCAGSLIECVTCVVGRVLWWLCGVGECSFGHLIILCVVHKYGFVLVVSMRSLRG